MFHSGWYNFTIRAVERERLVLNRRLDGALSCPPEKNLSMLQYFCQHFGYTMQKLLQFWAVIEAFMIEEGTVGGFKQSSGKKTGDSNSIKIEN